MSVFEVLIFVLIFIVFALKMFEIYNKQMDKIVPFVLMILIGFNLFIDGYRWQMVPIYIVSVVVIVIMILSLFKKSLIQRKAMKKRREIVRVVTLLLLFSFTLMLPSLLPVNNLPSPDGPYSVGITSFRLTDNSREEIFTEDENDVREFLVSVWYPADIDETDSIKSYWDESGFIGKEFSKNSGMGSFFFSHLSLVKTNSYLDAQISNEKESYPIIIYSHGFNGLNTDNTMLFETLASNGYIVFSINHTYESVGSLYPNGDFVASDFEYLNEKFEDNDEQFISLTETFNSTEDIDSQRDIVQQLLSTNNRLIEMIKVRTEDVSFLIDEMLIINQEHPILNSSLDLTHIGMMGYSLGGATATDVCITESRIKSCINIDGWPFGEVFNAENTVDKPFLLIGSERFDDFDKMVDTYIYEKLENDSYIVIIDGAEHPNFLDFPYLLNVFKHLGFWSPIDPLRLEMISEDLIVGFFDKYLKNEDVSIENISNKYEETTFTGKVVLD